MTISVIIPAYNEAKTISLCLKSLLNQTRKPDEIIVIDDSSTDKTVKQVKQFPQVKLLKQAHQGPGTARNLGASQAKGNILVFVDADMEFDKAFLAQLLKPILSGKAKGAWSGQEFVKNWHNPWARCWNYNQNRRTSRMISRHPGQKKVFRAILKSEFDKVKGFDIIGYTDDWTLVSKLGYQPKPTHAKFYHHHPDTLLEVFHQASWIGQRPYKLGHLGTFLTILKANAGFSVIIGLLKSILFFTPQFLIFKLVYDLGIISGAFQSLLGKRY
jgi:glycosyltransferase involved in cell wall biosynthesis